MLGRVGLVATEALFVGGMLATGCRHTAGLMPSAQARTAPGVPQEAFARVDGVAVYVNGDAWVATPGDLEGVMTPLWVSVEDRGTKAVRLMYEGFTLELPSGKGVHPLPPFSLTAPGPPPTGVVAASVAKATGFALSPFLEPYFPKLRLWYGVFPLDRGFHRSQFARWRSRLPTDDMVRLALAEGVLVPGGRVSGFLYFPAVAVGGGVVTFRAKLAEGDDGKTVAQLDIPLRPK